MTGPFVDLDPTMHLSFLSTDVGLKDIRLISSDILEASVPHQVEELWRHVN